MNDSRYILKPVFGKGGYIKHYDVFVDEGEDSWIGKFRPVYDKDHSIILFDMYSVEDSWFGSRRTLPQCEEALRWIIA